MNILSKIITKAITKPALRGKVRPLPTGGQRTQMESLGLTKAPEDMPVSSTDMPVSSDVNYTPTRADQGQPMATSDEEGMFNTAQRNRMDLIYGNDIDEPSLIQPLSDAPTRADQGQPMAPQPQRIDVVPPVRTEMDEFVSSTGGKGGGGDGTNWEDSASREQIREAYHTPQSKRQKQTPQLQEASQALYEKKITKEEWDEIADTFYPAQLITEMPDFPNINRVSATLTEGQVKKGIVGKTLDSKTLGGFIKNVGRRVASRLDINAYNNYNTWVVSIHDGSKLNGSTIGYGQTARLKNVEFKSNEDGALDIARGKKYNIRTKKDKPFGKSTIARIFGDWVDDTPEKVYELSKKELNKPNSEWVQIGMNPYKHSYFYDKKTMQPILSADEVIQVGPLVLARNVKRGNSSDFAFEEGGVVDMRNGGRVKMAKGGQAAAYDLSELEEDVDVSEKGLSKPYEYMTWLGNKKESGFMDTNHSRKVYGTYSPKTKKTYVGNVKPDGSSISKQEKINVTQHESHHSFGDFMEQASVDEDILKTLSSEARANLLQFVTFKQRVEKDDRLQKFRERTKFLEGFPEWLRPGEKPSRERVILQDSEHAIMNTPPELTGKPYSKIPDQVEGVGRSATINRLAEHFLKASAKNPEAHKRAMEKWSKQGDKREDFSKYDFSTLKGMINNDKSLEKNKGGVVDMRKGGKVGAAVVAASLMASGGQASASAFSPSKEFVEYIRSVENAGKKGYDKDTGLWHPFPPTGDVGEDKEEIYAGIVRPKGGSPLTQEAAEKLLGKRMQDAFKVAERVVDKRMKPGTFYRLPQRKKEVFVDYAFNMSEENFAKYKNFIPALVNDDKEGVEKEYIRNMRDENDNLIPLGRNKTFKKFFTEFFPERERSRASHSFSYFPKQTIL